MLTKLKNSSNPDRALIQMEVSGLFRPAFERVTTAGKAVAAFRDTRIYSFNPDVFKEDDFLLAEATKQEKKRISKI